MMTENWDQMPFFISHCSCLRCDATAAGQNMQGDFGMCGAAQHVP